MQFKEALKRKGAFREYVRSTFQFALYLDLKQEYDEIKLIVGIPDMLSDHEEVLNLLYKWSRPTMDAWSAICARMQIGESKEFRAWTQALIRDYIIPGKPHPRLGTYEDYVVGYDDEEVS